MINYISLFYVSIIAQPYPIPNASSLSKGVQEISQIAKFMGPTWGQPGFCRPQMGPMLAPWTLLSGVVLAQHNKANQSFYHTHWRLFSYIPWRESWYSQMPLKRGPVQHDIAYITAMIEAEYQSGFKPIKTPHISPLRVSYGMYFVRIWEKIDCVIMAPHCETFWGPPEVQRPQLGPMVGPMDLRKRITMHVRSMAVDIMNGTSKSICISIYIYQCIYQW